MLNLHISVMTDYRLNMHIYLLKYLLTY